MHWNDSRRASLASPLASRASPASGAQLPVLGVIALGGDPVAHPLPHPERFNMNSGCAIVGTWSTVSVHFFEA